MPRTQPHDALVKAAFTEVEHAVAHLRSILPAEIARRIDFSTLAVVPGSFVDGNLRSRHADILYRARLGRRQALIYVLNEHQSSVDTMMPFRVLRYEVRIWDAHLAAHPRSRRLPPIIALVVHHGATGWHAATAFEDLLDIGPDDLVALAAYIPRFRFVLDDLATTSDEALRERRASAFGRLVLWTLKHAHAPEGVLDGLTEWSTLIREVLRARNGQAAFETLLRYILEVHPAVEPEELKALVAESAGPDAEEATVNALERLMEKGRVEGRDRALRDMLRKQLAARFGDLDESSGARVDEASATELEAWALRVLSAKSLPEVFAEPTRSKSRARR